jgi:transcriptional regulator with XRE-family HTH domain
MKKEKAYELEEKKYMTQEEVARRFRVSPSTIKNWRDQGKLDFFQPDWSSRVLYPKESIDEFERKYIKKARAVDLRKYAEIKREVHGMSSDPKDEERGI